MKGLRRLADDVARRWAAALPPRTATTDVRMARLKENPWDPSAALVLAAAPLREGDSRGERITREGALATEASPDDVPPTPRPLGGSVPGC